jgi:hypothetical protein
MSEKKPRQKIDGQFVPQTGDLLRSDAWRTCCRNGPAMQIISSLCCLYMAGGGKTNGDLRASYGYFIQYGMREPSITKAIELLESCGLILCHRGGMRVVTRYALTWLPMPDGSMPDQPWRTFSNASLKPLQVQNSEICLRKRRQATYGSVGRLPESTYGSVGRSAPIPTPDCLRKRRSNLDTSIRNLPPAAPAAGKVGGR